MCAYVWVITIIKKIYKGRITHEANCLKNDLNKCEMIHYNVNKNMSQKQITSSNCTYATLTPKPVGGRGAWKLLGDERTDLGIRVGKV